MGDHATASREPLNTTTTQLVGGRKAVVAPVSQRNRIRIRRATRARRLTIIDGVVTRGVVGGRQEDVAARLVWREGVVAQLVVVLQLRGVRVETNAEQSV